MIAATGAFAQTGDLSLVQSVTSNGPKTGALRIDLGNGFCTDLSLAYTDNGTKTNDLDYWADLYYGSWGVLFSGNKDNGLQSGSFCYAVEHPINDNITLGVYTDLATFAKDKNFQAFSIFDAYVVLTL
jgi:hypothetical protein